MSDVVLLIVDIRYPVEYCIIAVPIVTILLVYRNTLLLYLGDTVFSL